MLNVIETERGKGLAKLLVKLFSKEFVDKFNENPITFIVENNLASRNLFKSLGYTNELPTYWLQIEPNN